LGTLTGTSTRSRRLPTRLSGATLKTVRTRKIGPPSKLETINQSLPQSPAAIQGTQTTVSENHPSWRKRRTSRTLTDIGGEFHSERRFAEGFESQSAAFSTSDATYNYLTTYSGPILPTLINLQFPAYHDSDIVPWGTKAIADCKPTNSVADASPALAEILREGLPKLAGSALWKERANKARRAPGSEYLNVEFGWKPLIRDVQALLHGIYSADMLLRQYERDAGKVVRRRYEFPLESESTSTVHQSGVSPWVGVSGGAMFNSTRINQGRVLRTLDKSTRRWFSGAFTYHLPSGYNTRNEMHRRALLIKKILGLEITPEVLWNLAPWTWAADWFFNAGSVLSNLSDWKSDGLVLRYGYIMEHTRASNTYTFSGLTGFNGSAQPSPIRLVAETKQRKKATPFGFGLTWNGFSPRQLAIAAALGITRS